MTEGPLPSASSSNSTSTASSPPITLASLSLGDSTDISLTSPDSVRSDPGGHQRKLPGTSSESLGSGSHSFDSLSEGYFPHQSPEIVHPPRHPSAPTSTPLSPHRIAKIANSFGVHIPIPHSAPTVPSSTRRSVSSGSFSQRYSRSTTATRLLLHVIPPVRLLSSNVEAPMLGGPRAQARRGTLLPLHTTLQGQLEAIKREYNFPSIAGLVVYLLETKDDGSVEEPMGPRISDEAWKLLWSRVMLMEREESQRKFVPLEKTLSSPPSPMELEDGTSESDSHSRGTYAAEVSNKPPNRRLIPLRIAESKDIISSSPSTTTLSSTYSFASIKSSPPLRRRLNNSPHPRSASLASGDAGFIASPRQLPPTPVAGKIEFDIDLEKGRWFEQWSHRKLGFAISRSSGPSPVPAHHRVLISTERLAQQNTDRLHLPNSISTSQSPRKTPHDSDSDSPSGYTPLDDENDQYDGIAERNEDSSKGIGLGLGLSVNDEADWQDLQSSQGPDVTLRPHAASRVALNAFLDGQIEEADPIGVTSATKDLEEVVAMWNDHSVDRPDSISTPSTLNGEPENLTPSDDSIAQSMLVRPLTRRRTIPPPLHLRGVDAREPSVEISRASPTSIQSGASLSYLNGDISTEYLSPADRSSILSDVSSGGDDADESDHSRNSQIALRKKLDNLERHIAQLSPRTLAETPVIPESPAPRLSPRELLDKLTSHNTLSPLPTTPRFMSKGFARPTPGQPLINTATSMSIVSSNGIGNTQWPAVPFEHVAQQMRLNRPPPVSPTFSNPPSVGSTPSRYDPSSDSEPSGQTRPRSQPPEEEYPSRLSTTSLNYSVPTRPATPAVLDPPPRTFSLPQPSSRFSADSVFSGEAASDESAGAPSPNPRVSVKSFTKLFRNRSKSRENVARGSREYPPSAPLPSASSAVSVQVPPVPDPPPRPPPSTPLLQGNPLAPRPAAGHIRADSGSDPFHFDQPTIRSPNTMPVSSAPSPVVPLSSASSTFNSSNGNPPNASNAPDRSSTGLKKRGILKGWGTSLKPSHPIKLPTPAEWEVESPSEHGRPESVASLASRGLKLTQRAESWISVSENVMVVSPAAPGPNSPTSRAPMFAMEDSSAAQFAGAAARQRRETIFSSRPPHSPASTESSGGPRRSVDEVMTPRTSQFDIVAPIPLVSE